MRTMKLKKVYSLVIAVCILMVFSGCGNGKDEEKDTLQPINVSCVLEIADGSQTVNLQDIDELLCITKRPGSYYSLTTTSAEIIDSSSINNLSNEGFNEAQLEHLNQEFISSLKSKMDSFKPSRGELDIIGGLNEAIRALPIDDTAEKNTIVLYSSLFNTTSPLDMATFSLADFDVQSTATQCSKHIDDMSNVSEIVVYQTTRSNAQMTSQEYENLRALYEKMFEKAGFKGKITFKQAKQASDYYHFEKKVSDVKVGEVVGDAVVLSSKTATFKPDTASLINEDLTKQALEPVIARLQSDSSLSISIYSTVAGDQDLPELANARSEKLASLLVEMGCEQKRIEIVQVSYKDDELYVFNLGTGPEAEVNRKSVIEFK